jgi:hypothetical protein
MVDTVLDSIALAALLSAGVAVTGDPSGFSISSAPGFCFVAGRPFSGPMVTDYTQQAPDLTAVNYGNAAIYFPYNHAQFESVETLTMAALKAVIGMGFTISAIIATTVDLSSLEVTEQGFSCEFPLAETIDLSSLVYVGGSLNCILTAAASIDLSSLETVFNGSIGLTAENLTSFALPALKRLDSDLFFQTITPPLDEESVDGILVQLASLDGTNDTTLWENHSVDLSGGSCSPPSVTGLAAKIILEGRGCTVTVNS